jgi:transcriptional regulator with XRE-family HTH domain
MASETRLHIASRIRLRREVLRLSLRDLADRLQVAVSELEEIEAGHRPVGAPLLLKLAAALDVPLRYFFTDQLTVPGDPPERAGFEDSLAGFAESGEIVRLVSAFDSIPLREDRQSVIDLAEAMALRHRH